MRANLDEVNARRRQHDQRELDPDNPEDVDRYGLLPQPRDDDTEQGEQRLQSPKRQPMLRFHALAGENTTQRLELVRDCAKSDFGAAQ